MLYDKTLINVDVRASQTQCAPSAKHPSTHRSFSPKNRSRFPHAGNTYASPRADQSRSVCVLRSPLLGPQDVRVLVETSVQGTTDVVLMDRSFAEMDLSGGSESESFKRAAKAVRQRRALSSPQRTPKGAPGGQRWRC